MAFPKDGFVGRGHVFTQITNESLRNRFRMERANEIEQERLVRMNKKLAREQRMKDAVLERMKEGTEKHLMDLNGYRKVLSSDFKVSRFTTMQRGFRREFVYSPRTARRLKLETRIYHGGYNMTYFQPEIKRKLRSVDPSAVKRVLNKVLKEINEEESGEVVDRKLSNPDYYSRLRELHGVHRLKMPSSEIREATPK